MKIINSIKFVLLLLGVGNLNLSFAQADLQDQASSLPKLYPSVPVHYQSKADLGDQLIAVQWMTEDFSKELKGNVKLVTLLKYGFNTLTKKQEDWNISKPGIEISRRFLKFVQETEINIGFLEENN